MSDQFYLTLPSDSSAASFPDNTIARYVTKLPERIQLDGDYEIGLSEISYPHSWYIIDNRDERFWIGALNFATGEFAEMAILETGYYKDPETFIDNLTQQTTKAFTSIDGFFVNFSFVKGTDRIRMQVKNSDSILAVIAPDLLEFLGFRRQLIVSKNMDRHGTFPFDLNRGLHLAYVYCDLVVESTIGDTRAPFLRVLNVSGEKDRHVQITYVRPHYVPVRRREFDTIAITINNELGRPMPFELGKSVVTLHFRRRQR